jgi:hypothetical protein
MDHGLDECSNGRWLNIERQVSLARLGWHIEPTLSGANLGEVGRALVLIGSYVFDNGNLGSRHPGAVVRLSTGPGCWSGMTMAAGRHGTSRH